MGKRGLPSSSPAVPALLVAFPLVAAVVRPGTAAAAGRSASAADGALDRALRELVAMPGGPPSATAIVQRGSSLRVHAFGAAAVGEPGRPRKNDYMRIASAAKALRGAVALSLSEAGVLSLRQPAGRGRRSQPV